jgi:multicomponent Na+:H+ antiporter subunit D
MSIFVVLPIIIPLASAALGLMAWRSLRVQRSIGLAGALALLGSGLLLFWQVHQGGILAVQMANWPAPFGITMVADLLGSLMVVLAGLMALTTYLFSFASIDARRQSSLYYPLLNIMLMGVCGAFLTGDIFNLYVWFEVLLISSFVLLALGGERLQLEGAIKYVTLNLMSSVLFLAAVGILYGMTGTLNMAHLAVRLADSPYPGVATTVAMLFLVAFGIKSAMFPLFFWLPASYPVPPFAISAIFAGLLTKVGVYAIIRTFTLIFTQDIGYTHTIILVLAGATMLTGVLGAASQYEFRRILAFHSISQIGYMIMGLALMTPLSIAGAVLFMFHHSIVKSALFLISGIAQHLCGTTHLKRPELSNLYVTAPWLGILFLVSALSLAGIPPLSGFVAKLFLIKAGLEVGQYAIVAVALITGMLTLFSMIKIWAEAFLRGGAESPEAGSHENIMTETPRTTGPVDEHAPHLITPRHVGAHEYGFAGAHAGQGRRTPTTMMAPIALLAVLAVVLGVAAGPVYTLAMRTAEQLLDPSQYIDAVLSPAGHGDWDDDGNAAPGPIPAQGEDTR